MIVQGQLASPGAACAAPMSPGQSPLTLLLPLGLQQERMGMAWSAGIKTHATPKLGAWINSGLSARAPELTRHPPPGGGLRDLGLFPGLLVLCQLRAPSSSDSWRPSFVLRVPNSSGGEATSGRVGRLPVGGWPSSAGRNPSPKRGCAPSGQLCIQVLLHQH